MKLKQMIIMLALVRDGAASRGADGIRAQAANSQRSLAPGGGNRRDL